MKTKDLIRENDKCIEELSQSILVEEILGKRKSLYAYYKDQFGCEPILLITDIFNAAQYGFIVPESQFLEYANDYADKNSTSEDDKEQYVETMLFNSARLRTI